jgi:hypothetical protein
VPYQGSGKIGDSFTDVSVFAGPPEKRARAQANACGWLFVEAEQNRRRAWCDMGGYGDPESTAPTLFNKTSTALPDR